MHTPFVKDKLIQYITRVEALEERKAVVAEDIKEVLTEAKSSGFDIRILKMILKIRKTDRNKLAEEEALLELYKEALEM